MLEKEFQEAPPAIQAQTLAWRAIARTQGDGRMPRWFLLNQMTRARCREDGAWDVFVELFRSQPGEQWETMEDGHRMLISMDQRTGEKRYVIHQSVRENEWVEIFQIKVGLTTGAVSLEKETRLQDLDPEDFHRHYSDAYPLPVEWQRVLPEVFGGDGD